MNQARRNFLKQAGSVLAAMAICPAALIPEERKRPEKIVGGTVTIMRRGTEIEIVGDVTYSVMTRGFPSFRTVRNLRLSYDEVKDLRESGSVLYLRFKGTGRS